MSGGFDDGVNGEHQAGRDQERADQVSAMSQARASFLSQQASRGRGRGQADRHVDEEDPVPADRLGDQPARQEADGGAGGGHEAEDAEGASLLVRAGKQGDDHGQDHRGAGGAADPLDEAGRDQHRLVEGEAAEHRGADEDTEPVQVDPLSAGQVAQAAGQQQQPSEGDQVGVDHPRQAGLGEAQIALDRGHGDVDDRHVDHDQEKSGAEDRQRQPARVFHAP